MRILSSFVLMLFAFASMAQQVSQSEALSYAQKFMAEKSLQSDLLTSVSYSEKGLENLYFFTNESNTSFIVIAGNKLVAPVIAYSFESGLDAQLPAPVMDYFIGVNDGIKKNISEKAVPDALVEAEWKSLSKYGELPVYLKSAVTPLLSTTWNQDCYYNDSVPEAATGPCGHCYAGCVATAMGQVMKYHNYPPVGIGSNVYGTGNYSHISVDFSQASYNWAAMPNSITTNNSYIAQLLYHAGVSVNMGYDFDGSGASSQDAAYAFADHFGYADYAFFAERDNTSDEFWIQLIDNELRCRRPVYYSGHSSSGGHAFVCDGIDNSNRLHINWGWGGSSNGYFMLSSMLGFNDGQAAIFGVEPAIGDVEYCQPSSVYTAMTDTIEDGSGVNKYGNGTNCSWTIQPADAGLIYIHFTEVALDKDMDVVYIYNGTSTSDPMVTSVTGFELPSEILVWGPSAHIVFQSDNLLRADGFKLFYTTCLAGIEEAWNEGKISVFPNPADEYMNIEIDPMILPAVIRIELVSMSGQTIMVVDNPVQSELLEVGSLSEGTYGLRFIGESDSFSAFIQIQ